MTAKSAADGANVVLDADIDAAVDDDGVSLRLTVYNDGDDAAEIRFTSGQRIEVVAVPAGDAAHVASDDGAPPVADDDAVAWRASDGRMYAQALGNETVPAGGSLTFEQRWSDPAPGDYRLVGEVVARGDRDLRAETVVSV